MSTGLVRGSIAEVAQTSGKALAVALMDADYVVLLDTSGSMKECDSTAGRSRYDVACDEMRRVQRELPGKIVMFSFSDDCLFCANGIPIMQGGGTDMLGALERVQKVDGAVKAFMLISDGYPDPGTDHKIINLVSGFLSRVDTIFAGPVEETEGRKFLEAVAAAGRGQTAFSASASNLSESAQKLLKGG